ncbi:MAG TPA: hypothetical protein VGI78_10890 [Acetobacteraceae bacterium]|jgi:hypothetical protein
MPDPHTETELQFLEDINAMISQTLEEQRDPWAALKALADEVRARLAELEEAAG